MDKLLKAADKGDVKKVSRFIKKGMDVNLSDDFGWTPLFRAAKKGHAEVVKLLLDAGAEVDKPTAGIAPLWWAAESGHTDAAKVLLDHGANINAPGKEGATALYTAVNFGRKGVIELLLEKGADVNAREEKYNWCPLHTAVQTSYGPVGVDQEKNRREIVELLLKFGADLAAKESSNGWTPLHIACFLGRRNLAEILLDGGAEINIIDDKGMTPLLWAVSEDKLDCAELLLDRGADANQKHQESGLTALGLANKFNYTQMADLLRKYGGIE